MTLMEERYSQLKVSEETSKHCDFAITGEREISTFKQQVYCLGNLLTVSQ